MSNMLISELSDSELDEVNGGGKKKGIVVVAGAIVQTATVTQVNVNTGNVSGNLVQQNAAAVAQTVVGDASAAAAAVSSIS